MGRPCRNAGADGTKGCEEVVADRSPFDECRACRRGARYWHKRRPAEIREYRRRLAVRTARIEWMIDEDDGKLLPRRERERLLNQHPNGATHGAR